MPDTISIHTSTHDAARRLCEALGTYCARVVADGAGASVEVDCDREFDVLLVGVLGIAEAFATAQPDAALRLVVDGHTYPLHGARYDGAAAAAGCS